MKFRNFVAAALLATAVAACAPSEKAQVIRDGEKVMVKASELAPSKSLTDSVSYLLGVNFGSFLKGYNFGSDLNWSEIEKGMKDFVSAKGNQRDSAFTAQFKVNPESMNEAFNTFLEKRQAVVAGVNLAKQEEFLAKNAKAEGVQTTESGLQYIIEEAGAETKISAQDTLYVKYVGKLMNGEEFDKFEGENGTMMMLDRVIAGWTEGLQLIGEGGKIKLFIPSELAYGERQMQAIEANSLLIFDIEVVSVKPYVEKAE